MHRILNSAFTIVKNIDVKRQNYVVFATQSDIKNMLL